MSAEMTLEEAWAIQMAYHRERGTTPPEDMDETTELVLREIMSDDEVETIGAALLKAPLATEVTADDRGALAEFQRMRRVSRGT